MTEKVRLSLQSSEKAVLQAASNIFSAYVAADKVNENNEDEFIQKSVELGIKMAKMSDDFISCDEEISNKLGQSKTLSPSSFSANNKL